LTAVPQTSPIEASVPQRAARGGKLLIISHERLVLNGTGGTTVMCGLTEVAIRLGWDVSYLALVRPQVDSSWEHLYELPAGSIRTAEVPILSKKVDRIRRFIGNFDLSATNDLAGARPAMLDESYDAVIAYDSLPIDLAKSVASTCTIGILGDPGGRRLWHSSSSADVKRKVSALLIDVAEQLYFRFTVPARFQLAMFGAGHASQWSRTLGRPVIDLRPFIPSPPALPPESPTEEKLILVFGGTLVSTASSRAYSEIFDGVLPVLRKLLGPGAFELRLVGNCPPALRKLAEDRDEIRITGRVPSFEAELAKGRIFLLPMKYPVGARTRVCSALAAGNICIVHPSVLFNMPELSTCEAVRVAPDASYYPEIFRDLLQPGKLNRLRGFARTFFDERYAAENATKAIFQHIEARRTA
jgi:hypothetical protein